MFRNFIKLFMLLLLSGGACLLLLSGKSHNRTQTELPFLIFSKGLLSVEGKQVFGKFNDGHYCSFPVFSYNPPRIIKKNVLDHLKKETLAIDGDLLLIVDDGFGMVKHYFHFMEHLIGIWNFLAHQDPDHIKMILFAFETPTEQDEQWVGPNETTRVLLTSLFPHAKIELLKNLDPTMNLSAKRILVSSRTRSHGIPQCTYFNMNGSSRSHYNVERLQQMRDRLFDKMGIEMEPRGNFLRITYCKRSTGRMLDPALEDLLLNAISQENNCRVNVVDFATLSFHEQLHTVANTDLFIGIHGNGLTHLLLLPDEATVLEYYQGGESAFFRLFAQLRGVRYYGNYQDHWVTEAYDSLENKAPFQDNVTGFDLENTMKLIKTLSFQ